MSAMQYSFDAPRTTICLLRLSAPQAIARAATPGSCAGLREQRGGRAAKCAGPGAGRGDRADPASRRGASARADPRQCSDRTGKGNRATNATDLTDFLNREFGSVHVNEVQGNPFQPDVNFRGYTASPLLGTPQGLSLYMDGVRLNQPFGDVVSWDLIPRGAIASITLIPGSNPLFGLNTLGGALSIQTKDGLSAPGTSLKASYGRFARRTGESSMAAPTRTGSIGISSATTPENTVGGTSRLPGSGSSFRNSGGMTRRLP